MITSPQNPKLKLVRALQSRARTRRKENAFVVEGVRLFEEALKAKSQIRFVLYDRTLSERGQALLTALDGVDVEEVDAALLNSVSDTENSQGILAVLALDLRLPPAKLNFVLVPDQIRDPGNLGTLIRTAAAAGVDAVFLPPETTDAFAPKVLRAGMGAHFRLPIVALDWDEIRVRVQGLAVYVAEMEGKVIYTDANLKQACAVIIGGEAEGASQSARALADAEIYIPMKDATESLNAAVAGAILLFEVARQRRGA